MSGTMLSFNDLLRKAKIDPSDVVLIKHHDTKADRDWTPYILWRARDPNFDVYQARQYPQKTAILRNGKVWAAFIHTPADETVFIGLYKNCGVVDGKIGAPRICRRGQTEDVLRCLKMVLRGSFVPRAIQKAEARFRRDRTQIQGRTACAFPPQRGGVAACRRGTRTIPDHKAVACCRGW
jgi:hypothetical protein